MTNIPGYTINECLHIGKSTSIYRALRNSDNHSVVIKISNQKILSEKKAQRFRREFELGRLIDSLYVLKYLELKQDPSYGMAMIMEDVEAVELTAAIPEGGFSVTEFLVLAIQIVQGLQAIHAAGIVHNDLKPSNIVFQPQTRHLKIIDFNRASTLRQEKHPAISTQIEVGTLAYLSPEQTGRINRQVDYRTDFYSLGVTFYQLLCGVLPFTAADALDLIYQHLATEPPPLHRREDPLSKLILKLLAKEAEKRYQSCEGLLYDLQVCQQKLQETGAIPEFDLGQQDFSSKLTLSQHLYGREVEIDHLEQAFERVGQGNREVLMVAGPPGVGKSMLIQELKRPITLKNGYFLQGKFDQLNKNPAYSAISQALDSLMKQLLTEEEASLQQWKEKLQNALGAHAQLMVQLVPALARIIGEPSPTVIADPSQAKTVFHLVFLNFIKVLAEATHPLVLFLDDLQWADSASLELMTYLLSQPTIHHLLWLGAYRDTEVTSSHPALQAIATLQEAHVSVQTLPLLPLSLESLQQWLADSLHHSPTDIQPLTELIYPKTAGNPFFVKSFVQSLYDQQLLTFAPQVHWQWDLAKIHRHPAAENVISLMAFQIQQLPEATQQALSIASCLGHRFALTTLQTAMAQDKESVCASILPALNNGILIQTDNEIQFVHDRVQEAIYALLSDVEKAQTHLMIGRRLRAHPKQAQALLLEMVAQSNQAHSLVIEPDERLHLARLNLQAGQQVKQATAYGTALAYLYASRNWTEAEALWQTDYSLAFTLHKELVETEYLSGHFDKSQELITKIQPHVQFTLDKVELYHLLIRQKILQGLLQEAILLGHEALQLLGSGLPLENPSAFLQRELPLLQQRLAGKPLSSLLELPLVTEPEKRATFTILADIMSPCYNLGSELLPAVILMSINLSLTSGHTPESCFSYAAYGLLLCAQYQAYAEGYAWGELALQLAEKLASPVQRCRSAFVMYGFIYEWSKPIQHLPALLASTFDQGLACGEIEYASHCGIARVELSFNQGARLEEVYHVIATVLAFAQSINTTGVIYNILRGFQKIVANLLGETQHEADFNDSAGSEADFKAACQEGSGTPLGYYFINKAQVLYLYGQDEQALQQLELAREKLPSMLGVYTTALFNWYDSLIRLALYSSALLEDQAAYLQQITQNQQHMKKWMDSCPENFAHKYLLVAAEIARLQGQHAQAESYYDQAIDLAGRQGFIQEQALAAELAAKALLARNKRIAAQGYLNIAFTSYKQWGAKRKAAQLQNQYAELLQPFAPALSSLVVDSHTTLSAHALKSLDLTSIIQAFQEIFKERELNKLLQQLIQLIVRTAGAQKGALFFVELEDTLMLKAEYAKDGPILTLQNTLLADWPGGASNVIKYVKRMHQPLVIESAIVHEQFKTDAYIQRTQAKSILCLPIILQQRLIAILYAENNLLPNVFTSERVKTLQVLTTPMAIALENARFFAEQQVLTESLRMTSERLHLALEASKSGFWEGLIESNQNKQIIVDAVCATLYGLPAKETRITYEEMLEMIHPEDRAQVREAVRRCHEQDEDYDSVHRVKWPDGSEHVIQARGRAYRDKSGQAIKMVGVNMDITQRKRLEQERQDALKKAAEEQVRREEAQAYQQRQKEFTDTICHEVRNPVLGLMGTIDHQQEQIEALKQAVATFKNSLSAEQYLSLTAYIKASQENVGDSQECIKHLNVLLDDVLNFSKLEAQKLELDLRAIQPKAAIDSVVKMFKTKFATKQLKLEPKLPEEDIIVKGDAPRLKQILINLLANALKFTERGGVTIELKVLSSTPSHVQLQFTIIDTGIGMTQEQQSRLFQRFAQANARIATEYGGTGLGLEISDKLVKLMGGQIKVESEEGKGSQFSFVIDCEKVTLEEVKAITPLPAQAQAVAATQRVEPARTGLSLFLPARRKASSSARKILLVDDTPLNQKILANFLKKLGYETVVVANNGQEAVDAFVKAVEEGSPVGLIFMDIVMPVLDGYEVTRQIRRKEQAGEHLAIPIIGCTGHTDEAAKQQALAAGMNDVLVKPFKKEEVEQMMNKWLEVVKTESISQEIAFSPS